MPRNVESEQIIPEKRKKDIKIYKNIRRNMNSNLKNFHSNPKFNNKQQLSWRNRISSNNPVRAKANPNEESERSFDFYANFKDDTEVYTYTKKYSNEISSKQEGMKKSEVEEKPTSTEINIYKRIKPESSKASPIIIALKENKDKEDEDFFSKYLCKHKPK